LSNILKCVIHCQLHELMHIATTCKANLGNVMFFEVLYKKRIETRQRRILMGGWPLFMERESREIGLVGRRRKE
jgi:hypothetical protein